MNHTPFPEGSLPLPTADPQEARRTFSHIGIAYALLILILQLAVPLIRGGMARLAPAVLSRPWWGWVLSLVPLYGLALPLAWQVLKRVPPAPHNTHYTKGGSVTLEKPPLGIRHWGGLMVIAFGCMTIGGLMGNLLMSALSALLRYDYANALQTLVAGSPPWMTLVATCICAPLGEELLFRKLLIDRTRAFGDLPSILLSGLLFGLFHGNLFQFFYAALAGMLLAYLYTRTGRYSWCVVSHALINLMGSVVIPALAARLPSDAVSFSDGLQPLLLLFLLLWQHGMLLGGIVLLCVLLPQRKLSRGSDPLPRGRAASLMLGNPGMSICLGVMGLLLLLNLWPVR